MYTYFTLFSVNNCALLSYLINFLFSYNTFFSLQFTLQIYLIIFLYLFIHSFIYVFFTQTAPNSFYWLAACVLMYFCKKDFEINKVDTK